MSSVPNIYIQYNLLLNRSVVIYLLEFLPLIDLCVYVYLKINFKEVAIICVLASVHYVHTLGTANNTLLNTIYQFAGIGLQTIN